MQHTVERKRKKKPIQYMLNGVLVILLPTFSAGYRKCGAFECVALDGNQT